MKLEKPHFILTAAIASVLALAPAAFAASGTWGNPAGGSWNSSGNWSGGTIADGSGFTADFSTLDITAGAKTVTLDADHVIGNLTFGDTNTGTNGAWVLATGSGGTLTLAGTTPTITANVSTNISAVMLGTSGFTKSGVGTLTLTGGLGNTSGGAINVNAGTLNVADGLSLKNMSGAITVASGAVFNYSQAYIPANNLTNALNLSGPGAGSNGALNLQGNATANGPITLDADTTISHSYNTATISGSITGTNRNLTLKTTQSAQPGLVVSAPITLGTGRITVQSAGGTNIVTLSGNNSHSGGTILSTGTLKFSHAGALGSGTVTFEGNTTLQAGVAATLNHAVILDSGATGTLDTNAYDVVLGGAITGSGNLVKSGNGRLELTGANTYSGPTTVSAGTLALVGGSQASPITVAGGASLEFTLGAPCTSTSSVNLSSGTVKITNTPSQASYTLMTASGGFIGTPVLSSPVAGYALVLASGGTELRLVEVYAKYTYPFPDGSKFVASDDVNNTPRDLILQAISSGATTVTIPPGIYRMTPEQGVHIKIHNVENLTINAPNVIILCDVMTRAIDIKNCQNLVINGLIIDYAPTPKAFPFTQGEVIATGKEGDLYTADVKIHEGYPLDIGYASNNTWNRIKVYDPVYRTHIDNAKLNWSLTSELVDVNQRIVRIKEKGLDYIKTGDLAALTSGYTRFGTNGVPHTVSIDSSTNTSFNYVTIHTSISFGIWHAGGAGGGTFRNVRIVRGPNLPGATEPRLKTTMHDGWKISRLTQGVTVEDCVIEHTGDDGWSVGPGTALDQQCDGYVFRRNRMEGVGRLLLSAGSNAVIENNDLINIDSVSFAETAVGMSNVIFRNNRMVHVAHQNQWHSNTPATGAFNMAVAQENGTLITSPLFHDFQILDNEFIECKIPNINITGANGLTMTGNTFSESGTTPPLIGGESFPFKKRYMINLFNSSDVGVNTNTVESPGIYCKGFLNVENCTNVTAPSNGYTFNNAANDAPAFFADPFSKPDGTVDSAYSGTLADDAGDIDMLAGETLTYSKVLGPAWLNVADDGALSGNPGTGDGGINTFTVRVQDLLGAYDTAELNILVNSTLAWDGGGPVDTWSDPRNWNAAGNDDFPDSNLETAEYNGGASINIAVNGNFTIRKFNDGYAGAGQTATLSGSGVLTLDGNSASVVTGISNATGGSSGSTLAVDCGVVINNSLGGETRFGIGNSTGNVIRFGPDSTLSLQSPLNAYARTGSMEFNGTIGNSTSDLVLTGAVSFGTGHNSSAFNRDMLLASTSKLTIDAGTVLSADRKFQITGTGSELELNGANVVNDPDVSVQGDYDFLIDVNASQNDFGWLKTDRGTVTIDLAAGVNLLAFDDSSGQDWTNGSVLITNFRPGVIQFGTNAGGITANQLASITAYDSGGAPVSGLRIDSSGFLTNLNDSPAPPAFTTNPLNTADATEDIAYIATIAGSATDANGDTLSYAKVSGPAWLSVAEDGALSGTPGNNDAGANSFTISVSDGIAPPVEATLNITVININDAPVWASNPITAANATEDAAYSGSLAANASDVDAGATLTFAKVSGPAWLTVGSNGALSGTPTNSDVGANSFTVGVSDGIAAPVETTLSITVDNTNDAPVWTVNPITGADASEDVAYSGSIAGSASDADGGATLTFAKVSGPAWLSVAANGVLAGTPFNSDVGANIFTVSVSDSIAAPVQVTLNITVINTNDAPVWSSSPIVAAGASENVAYTSQTLAGQATDADAGAVITYSKVSGPAWLVIASDGALSGTPPSGTTGLNSFVVRATDNNSATADATLQIDVTGLPLPWLSADIGMGMLAGSASFDAGTFTQSGSGVIGSTSDKLHFTYQILTGDGEIIARISNLQNTGNSSRVGVMIRDMLAPNSKRILMGLTGSGSYRWARRTTTGGSTSSSNSSSGTVPNTWVRLVRSGTTITAYKSTNGTSWTTVGDTTNTTFGSTCYIGLAVGSGSNTTLNTSQFSNVSVTP